MNIVEDLARDLGRAIQSDERYQRFMESQKKNDEDMDLQGLIAQFEVKRMELNDALEKEGDDTTQIKELDGEVKSLYRDIFANSNMVEFSEARNEMQNMMSLVNRIITGSANGENPDVISDDHCSGCSGCGQ